MLVRVESAACVSESGKWRVEYVLVRVKSLSQHAGISGVFSVCFSMASAATPPDEHRKYAWGAGSTSLSTSLPEPRRKSAADSSSKTANLMYSVCSRHSSLLQVYGKGV